MPSAVASITPTIETMTVFVAPNDERVQERVGRLVGQEVRTDWGLVLAVQEAESVGDLPVLYGIGDVGEEPYDQDDDQYPRQDLGRPLDDLDMPPDRVCPGTWLYCEALSP